MPTSTELEQAISDLAQAMADRDASLFRAILHRAVQSAALLTLQSPLPEGWTPLRLGVHYASASLGRWFRATYEASSEYPPFGTESKIVDTRWRDFYEELPKGINYLIDDRITVPLVVQFGGAWPLAQGENWLHIDDAEWAVIRALLRTRDLFQDIYQALEAEYREEMLARYENLTRLASRALKWLRFGGFPEELSGLGELSALQTILYTWFPTLTKRCPPVDYVMLAVTLPFPERQPPRVFATMAGLYLHKLEQEGDAVRTVEQHLRPVFGELLGRLIGLEALQLADASSPRNLAVEKSVRHFRFVTEPMILGGDRAGKWRELFPLGKERFAPPYRWWDVPLWACSDRMVQLLRDLEDRLLPSKDKVETIFFHSSPGCGKETLARLCHFLSRRARDLGQVMAPREIWMREFGGEIISQAFEADGRRLLEIEKTVAAGQSASSVDARRADPNGTLDPWQFNFFVVDCARIPGGDLDRALIGDTSGTKPTFGALLKASMLSGTVFIDEFDSLKDPHGADLFLRLCEGEQVVEVPWRGGFKVMPVDALLIFASNLKPEELIRRGWKEAVLTRIAPRDRVFRIPSLAERPEDIPVAVAYQSQIESKGRVDLVHLDAMRLLAALPWSSGNLRELRAFIKGLIQRRALGGGPTTDRREVDFMEVVESLEEQGYFSPR